MEPLAKSKVRDEAKVQREIIDHLTLRGWYVQSTHGNAYQSGLPDLFCCHQSYGARWVEVKKKEKYAFTESQLTVFTKFASKNIGVWVMTDPLQYNCLFSPANWYTYLLNSRGITLKDKVEIIPKKGPEAIIQNAIIAKLTRELPGDDLANWFCIETYGSLYQSGFADIYACHVQYGARWIECKNPKKYCFTPAQMRCFPRFQCEGVGIWILTSSHECDKLFKACNWRDYL